MKTSLLVLMVVAVTVSIYAAPGGGGPKDSGTPVTHYVFDENENLTQYSIQSDGLGPYFNNVDKMASLIYPGGADRVLQSGVIGDYIRGLRVTFSHENAVQPGDPGYLVPANPPAWGTLYPGVRFMNKCSETNTGFMPMKAGDKIICQMHMRLWPLGSNNDYYRLDMGTPGEDETQRVQITCNGADSAGCKDWFIDPIPVVNEDGSITPGKTRARLNFIYFIRNRGYMENRGAYYTTFHIRVTRP